jgi:hypothetical protein
MTYAESTLHQRYQPMFATVVATLDITRAYHPNMFWGWSQLRHVSPAQLAFIAMGVLL